MKVYIVTQGSYSDYHIKAVFNIKSDAEIYVNIMGKQWDGEHIIEEWDIDKYIEDMRNGLLPFAVCLHLDGTLLTVNRMYDIGNMFYKFDRERKTYFYYGMHKNSDDAINAASSCMKELKG